MQNLKDKVIKRYNEEVAPKYSLRTYKNYPTGGLKCISVKTEQQIENEEDEEDNDEYVIVDNNNKKTDDEETDDEETDDEETDDEEINNNIMSNTTKVL